MSDKHATEARRREITETFCTEDGCEFRGRPAVQGVCHDVGGDLADWARLDEHDAELNEELKAMREREGDDYVRALEAHYICAMMNWQLTLDECIRLRRDNALIKGRVASTTQPAPSAEARPMNEEE